MPLTPEFRETFGRIWEEMKTFNDWEPVYMWEVDADTLSLSPLPLRRTLAYLYMVWETNKQKIASSYHKDQNHIRVGDVDMWIRKQFNLMANFKK